MSQNKPIVVLSYGPLDEAIEAFNNGEIVAYPTETFYGLAVDPFNEDAVRKLFELKGRDFGSPLTVIVNEKSKVFDLAEDVPDIARKLMDRFWPGPLSIIFKANSKVPDILTSGKGTIGIRVSVNPVAVEFAREVVSPITATSANPAGLEGAVSADKVIEYFGDKLGAVIDGGEVAGGMASTVVDVSKVDKSGSGVEVIREGVIETIEILKVY